MTKEQATPFMSKLLDKIPLRGQRLYLLSLVILMLIPNFVLTTSPYLSLLGSIINLIFPAALYALALSSCPRPGKVLLVFFPFFILLGAFQLVLLTLFSGTVAAVDMFLNLVSSNSEEGGELLSGIFLPILLALAILVLTIWIAIRSIRSRDKLPLAIRKRICLGATCGIAIALGASWCEAKVNDGYRLYNEVYPLNVLHNIYIAFGKFQEVRHYKQTSRDFSYNAKREEERGDNPELIVFVLGETSRTYNWSIYGYERDTNPLLSRRGRDIITFKDLTTQSNTTFKSVPILLSPADASNSHRLPEVKGIFTALKEAGFHTVYISNQPENRSFLDFFAGEADEVYRIRDIINKDKSLMERTPIYDGDMLPFLDEAIRADHPRTFVLLHTYGAHWSYKDRYPNTKEAKRFVPDDALGANRREREKLVNAYDNAILYTDYLLNAIIERLEKKADIPSALFYTSDHGEDIFDDSRNRILHSSPDISYYQVHVPAILWLSPLMKASYPHLEVSARANAPKAATSASTFHTLLSLSGVETIERKDSLSLLSPQYHIPSPRLYLNDRYEAVPLSLMIQQREDLEVWDRLGLHPLTDSPN